MEKNQSLPLCSSFFCREILGSESLWPLLLAFSGLTATIQLVMLPCFPDSPPYLLIQKGNEEAFLKGRILLLQPKREQGRDILLHLEDCQVKQSSALEANGTNNAAGEREAGDLLLQREEVGRKHQPSKPERFMFFHCHAIS